MRLRDFQPATKTVNGITVRGVSVRDMAVLTEAYGPTLIKIFKMATEPEADFGGVVSSAAREAPLLVSVLIQMLILDDDPDRENVTDELAKIDQMNIGMQTELLEGIFHSTFETEADIKKMVEAIAGMLNKVSAAVEQVPQLPTGNTTSVSESK